VPAYLAAALLPVMMPAGANFEYEYALYASLLSLLLIPVFGLILPQKSIPDRFAGASMGNYLWVFVWGPLIALVPGLFFFLTGRCQCAQTGHYFWMLLQWYPAWILAHAFYFGFYRGRILRLRRDKMFAAWLTVLLALTLLLILSLWMNPQKRALHLLAGFIHGPVYDDWIALDAGIIVGRLAHLFLATLLLLLVWLRDRTAHLSACIILAGAWFIASVTASWSPSVGLGASKLNRAMRGKVSGDGFVLHYAPGEEEKKKDLAGQQDLPPAIKRLARDAQFHVTELRDILKESTLPQVDIYVYPDADSKKLWFGGGSTDVADVYSPSIHITAGDSPHPTLRHELVHALTSGLAFHGLGFHPNMAFTEGLAVALAPTERTLSLDESAAAIIAAKRVKNVESLFSAVGFWRESGGRAYSIAGSLIQYLISAKGIEGVKQLYAGLSWDQAIGEPQERTIAKWQAHIKNLYDPKKNGMQAEALYRYPGILNDLCPHSKADLRRSRSEGVLVRLRQPVGWDPDIDYNNWLLTLAPESLNTRLSIWRTEAKKVAEERVPNPEKLRSWRETVGQARTWPPKAIEDIELALLESDLRRVEGDRTGSLNILNEALEFAKSTSMGDGLLRQFGARVAVESAALDTTALDWRKYLAGWRRILPEAKPDESWTMTYLRLRRAGEKDMGDPEMLKIMADAPADEALGVTRPAFQLEWYRMITAKLMHANAYEAAAQVLAKMADIAPAGHQELIRESQRRAQYYAKSPE